MPIPTEPSTTCRCYKKNAFAHSFRTRAGAVAATIFPRGEETSSSSSSLRAISGSLVTETSTIRQQQQQEPVVCLEEPNLYQLPTDFHPTYRPLPLLVRMAVWMLSSMVVVACSNNHGVGISSSSSLSSWISRIPSLIWTRAALLARGSSGVDGSEGNYNNCVRFLFFRFITSRYFIASIFKILVLSFGINMALQERFRPPSRISTRSLMERYYLPSKLSRFENVSLLMLEGDGRFQQQQEPFSRNSNNINVGVHWLEYQNRRQQGGLVMNKKEQDDTTAATTTRRVLHLNHGFGASSLSWLPALPVLVEQLNCHVGLAHDAPGFGFTNRRRQNIDYNNDDVAAVDYDDEYYTTKRSAKIGQALLLKASSANSTFYSSENVVAVLMGHSMGSLTTLRMALDLIRKDKQNDNSFNITRCHIILVAPVFRTPSKPPFRTKSTATTTEASRPPSRGGGRSWFSVFRQRIGRLAVDRPAAYALRRLVSQASSNNKKNRFWRWGLGQVWGDATRLSDADILRFQWPSIGQGWEDGLIQFSKAQFASSPSSSSNDSINNVDDARSILQQVLTAVQPQVTVDVIVGEKDPLVPVKSIDNFFAEFMATTTSKESNAVRMRVLPGLGHDPFEEDVEAFVETVKELLLSSSSS
jgi:pimeloyl-ACP methyl ester carboxylesterase